MAQGVLAIIPARGGSKGIPLKNIQPIAGKPLLAYSIESARRCPSVTRIVVSTDNEAVAAAAVQYGAEVVWRPDEISGDEASSESAMLHVLDQLRDTEGYQPELLVFLQCTSPLTLPEDIEGTIRTLLDEDADSALAVAPFHYFVWRRVEGGDANGINHEKPFRPRRQDREPQYLETGAVYVMRADGFRLAKHRFFGKTVLHVMPEERRLEVDEPTDLLLAEVLLREQQKLLNADLIPDPVAALIMDFDGVFTDNRVLVQEDGREGVMCDRGDGWGLAQLKRRALPMLVLSTEVNLVVHARCRKLEIECLQGVGEKLPVLLAWLGKRGIDASRVVYVGNDVNDLACLGAAGCGVAVSDAHPAVKAASRIVLSKPGGHGAIRELAELIEQRMRGEIDGKGG